MDEELEERSRSRSLHMAGTILTMVVGLVQNVKDMDVGMHMHAP